MKFFKIITLQTKIMLLCIILSIISCTRDEEVQVESVQKLSVANQISKLSENYNVNPGKAADVNWLKVAAADAGAALTEASGDDATIASITMAGASASTKNYNDQNSSNSSSSNNSGGSNTIDPNETNPYDYVGYWHYASIDNVLVDPKRYLNGKDYDNERFYKATVEFLLKNDVASDSDYESFILELANEKLAFNSEVFDKYGLSGGLTYLLEKGIVQESVYEVMMPYYNVFESVNSSKEFVEYSLQVEELVVKSKLEEKEIILSTMATARYGAQYWSSVFGDY